MYVFSDGKDTSGDKEINEKFRDTTKLLHQQLGVSCRFIQCGTTSMNIIYSNFDWLVGRKDITAMSGTASTIREQCTQLYKQDHSQFIKLEKNSSQAKKPMETDDEPKPEYRKPTKTSVDDVASSTISQFKEPTVLDIQNDSQVHHKTSASPSTVENVPTAFVIVTKSRKR